MKDSVVVVIAGGTVHVIGDVYSIHAQLGNKMHELYQLVITQTHNGIRDLLVSATS
jgi:hypothetical protein